MTIVLFHIIIWMKKDFFLILHQIKKYFVL